MVRAVLDANVIVSAQIRPEGPPGLVLERFLAECPFILIVSESILAEVQETLASPRIRRYLRVSDEEVQRRLDAIRRLADPVPGTAGIRAVSRDPDDDKYIAAAVEGRADFLVTGDNDLLVIRDYAGIRMVTPRTFLDALGRRPAT